MSEYKHLEEGTAEKIRRRGRKGLELIKRHLHKSILPKHDPSVDMKEETELDEALHQSGSRYDRKYSNRLADARARNRKREQEYQAQKVKDREEADHQDRVKAGGGTQLKLKFESFQQFNEARKIETKIRKAAEKMQRDMEKKGKSEADIMKALEMNFPSLFESADVEEANEPHVTRNKFNMDRYNKQNPPKKSSNEPHRTRYNHGGKNESVEVEEGYRNIMTTHEGEKFKSKLHATKKDADDHHWKMTKATDKRGKKIYKKIETVKEEQQLDELKRDTLASYINKASDARGHRALPLNKVDNRYKGVKTASDKLSGKAKVNNNESVEVEEATMTLEGLKAMLGPTIYAKNYTAAMSSMDDEGLSAFDAAKRYDNVDARKLQKQYDKMKKTKR